jgi:hypothetical protein
MMLRSKNNLPPSDLSESDTVSSSATPRDLQLGIDYGTSTSKLVLRDYAAPGGERAYLVGKETGYRYPSAISCDSTTIIFGDPAGTSGVTKYESVKMQVADQVKNSSGRYYYGPKQTFPPGFDASALAALTIWWLISKGETAARHSLTLPNPRIAMTIGIPMSFRADSVLRSAFLQIARIGFDLYRSNGLLLGDSIDLTHAQRLFSEASDRVNSRPPVPDDQIVAWVRSEAEAAMLWAFRSPSVPAGRYFKVDIGAGTTNASIFRLNEKAPEGEWLKSEFRFFGAYSGPHGMDAVDVDLAAHLGVANPFTLRGTEDSLLAVQSSADAVRAPFEEIRKSFEKAWGNGYQNISGPLELRNWDDANIFVIGGGSLVSRLRDYISVHPDGSGTNLSQRQSEVPTDLYLEEGTKPAADLVPFVMVAYGLSNLGLQVPDAETPETMTPMDDPPKRRRITHEELYGD